jgi:hypothetical protein
MEAAKSLAFSFCRAMLLGKRMTKCQRRDRYCSVKESRPQSWGAVK